MPLNFIETKPESAVISNRTAELQLMLPNGIRIAIGAEINPGLLQTILSCGRSNSMLKLTEETRIYVADKPVDCRKAINGLASMVIEQFEKPVNDGSVYVFYNGSCDRSKMFVLG